MRRLRGAWVSSDQKDSPSPNLAAFRGGKRDLGYVEGQQVVIESWWGEGSSEHVTKMAIDAVRSRPDIIVAAGGVALSGRPSHRLPTKVELVINLRPPARSA